MIIQRTVMLGVTSKRTKMIAGIAVPAEAAMKTKERMTKLIVQIAAAVVRRKRVCRRIELSCRRRLRNMMISLPPWMQKIRARDRQMMAMTAW